MTPRLATPPASSPTPEKVHAACRELALPCDEPLARQLCSYLGILQKWNARMNLVGPAHWKDILEQLAADSWHLADFLQVLPLPESPSCLDLGAGAGLPGIPLRMLWDKGSYIMVELRQKRALFLGQVLAQLPLQGVSVRQARAEDVLEEEAPLDLILSRAFMPWSKLLELVRPHLAPEGVTIVMANEAPPEKLPTGWKLARSMHYSQGKDRCFWALTPWNS